MIDYRLNGKVAIVTGGVSGIGLAVTELLACSGAHISVWDLQQDKLDKVVTSLRSRGVKAMGVALDVTDYTAVDAAVKRTVDELGS